MLVQPSLYDLCPLPVLEGMASGLPIVASRVGGPPEMVSDGETGILVEPDDPSQLSEALLMLLEDPRKVRAMGEASTARARSLFSWEATASRLRSFYEQWNKAGA